MKPLTQDKSELLYGIDAMTNRSKIWKDIAYIEKRQPIHCEYQPQVTCRGTDESNEGIAPSFCQSEWENGKARAVHFLSPNNESGWTKFIERKKPEKCILTFHEVLLEQNIKTRLNLYLVRKPSKRFQLDATHNAPTAMFTKIIGTLLPRLENGYRRNRTSTSRQSNGVCP